jgi:hypothetical protein
MYRKVASTSPSCLEAHGKFDDYLLLPFWKKLIYLL